MCTSKLPIRVLIADDAEVVRRTLRRFLECEPSVEVCGEAVNFSQTLELTTSLKPDVILLDLHMPDGHSFESASAKLRSTSSRILAMSLSHEDGETQIIAKSCGAVAVLDKATLCDELIPAIHRVSGLYGQNLDACT